MLDAAHSGMRGWLDVAESAGLTIASNAFHILNAPDSAIGVGLVVAFFLRMLHGTDTLTSMSLGHCRFQDTMPLFLLQGLHHGDDSLCSPGLQGRG